MVWLNHPGRVVGFLSGLLVGSNLWNYRSGLLFYSLEICSDAPPNTAIRATFF
jgi:hypothetical protein